MSKKRADIQKPDLSEKGGPKDGKPQSMDTRLFIQLQAFGGCADTAPVVAVMEQRGFEGVVYEDVNDPSGIAIVTWNEDPSFFAGPLREMFQAEQFASLTFKPEFTMLGRT